MPASNTPEYNREYARKNREAINARRRARYAENPSRRLKENQEYRDKNRESLRESQRVYRQNNLEKVQAGERAKRAARRAVPSESYTLEDVFFLYGTDCYLCGNPIDLTAPRWTRIPGWENGLHLEHVVPLSRGGTDTLDNVRPSHGKCNLKKHY